MVEKDKSLVIFSGNQIRRIWSDNEWYFVIVDVIKVLTDSVNPRQYIKNMRNRDEELSEGWVQIERPLSIDTAGGKQSMSCANTEGIFRIIQSIPSKKAEPFKKWLAKVGSERIDEESDPELAINRAMQNYLKLGYSEKWINQRLRTIEARKELTDEWKRSGVMEGREFSILTNEMMRAWSGKSIREYKEFKNLKKENLRDNMTTLELALNMLAEATTTEISKKENPEGLDESLDIVREGGEIAGNARKEIEGRTRNKVISPINSKKLIEENKMEIEKDE